MRIHIYSWIHWVHSTITHYFCFLKHVVLLLAAVRINPLWQNSLRKKGLWIQGKSIVHSRRGFEARGKVLPPVGVVLSSYHHFTILFVITLPLNYFTIILFHYFTITPLHHYTITPLHHSNMKSHHHFTIATLQHVTIKPLQHFMIDLRVGWTLPKIKYLQDKSSYVSSS